MCDTKSIYFDCWDDGVSVYRCRECGKRYTWNAGINKYDRYKDGDTI